MTRPDTSPANVARVLRSDADEFDALKMHGTAANRRALADALDAQPDNPLTPDNAAYRRGVEAERAEWQRATGRKHWAEVPTCDALPTWEERVEWVRDALWDASVQWTHSHEDRATADIDAVLRAAFPELAPVR